jgi:hypothetical protein
MFQIFAFKLLCKIFIFPVQSSSIIDFLKAFVVPDAQLEYYATLSLKNIRVVAVLQASRDRCSDF